MPDSSNNTSALNADISSAGRLLSDPPGAVLKRARQARKLDLETAADQLNLSAQVVRALEEDAYDKLPSPTFIRGYIRCYARLLKLSGDDLVRSYERVAIAQQPESQGVAGAAKAKPLKIKKGWIVLGVLLVAVLAIGFVVTSDDVAKNVEPKTNLEAGAAVSENIVENIPAETVVDSTIDTAVSTERETAVKIAPTIEPKIAPKVVTITDVSVEIAPVTEPVAEPVIIPATVSADVIVKNTDEAETEVEAEVAQVNVKLSTLTMAFSGECWVEVWDATGARIYADLRNAGQRVSLQGVAPIEVKLGDGSMVKLTFNGSPVLFASSKRTSVAHVTLGEKIP